MYPKLALLGVDYDIAIFFHQFNREREREREREILSDQVLVVNNDIARFMINIIFIVSKQHREQR